MTSDRIDALLEEAARAATHGDVEPVLQRFEEALADPSLASDRGRLLAAKSIAGQHVHPREYTAALLDEAIPLLAEAEAWDDLLGATTHASANALLLGDTELAIDFAVDSLTLMNDGAFDTDSRPSAASNLSFIFSEFGAYELSYELAETAFLNMGGTATSGGALITSFNLVQAAVEGQRRLTNLDPRQRERWLTVAEVAGWVILNEASAPVHRKMMGHGALARVALERGDLANAREHIDVARTAIEGSVDLLAGITLLVEGMILRQEGRPAEALGHLNRAIVTFDDDYLPRTRALMERSETYAELGDYRRAYEDSQLLAVTTQERHGDQVGHLVEQVRHRAALERSRITLVQEADELTERMRRDDLTGVSTRGWFDVRLDNIAEQVGHTSVILLDIDHFKSVNDRFGHLVGDEVLRRIGAVLAETSRDDDLVARYGGEEFVIIPARGALAGASQLAERLRFAIEQEDWSAIHSELRVTTSAGVSIGPASEVRTVLRCADDALYIAKARGRNRVVGLPMDETEHGGHARGSRFSRHHREEAVRTG